MPRKLISLTLTLSFLLQQTVFAYSANLNLSNYLNSGTNQIALDRFRPVSLRYFSYQVQTNDFKVLLDKGDSKESSLHSRGAGGFRQEAAVLLDYFKIGLSLPNDKFWVNLRPEAEDEIIDEQLAKTDLGKVMLEADLKLKQDTSLFTSPATPQGKEYWNKLYKKAGELFGTENITIPTLTRPWIVPGEIILRESNDKSSQGAYIYKANLKVMLEEDYLEGGSRTAPTLDGSPTAPTMRTASTSALSRGRSRTAPTSAFSDPRLKELNSYSTQLIRELILPRLTQKVNSSKDYANLRQVYFSLILARWFKETFSSQPTFHISRADPYIKLIDSNNLTNLTSKTPWDKTTYFNAYQKSFQEGEYNLSEAIYTPTGQVIRRYMSGGANMMAGSPMEWSGRFMGKIKDLPSILKNLVGIDVKNQDHLSDEDKNMLKAGLMNIFDASVDMNLIKGAATNFIYLDQDSSFNLPAKMRNFIERIEESQDGKEFLENKTRLALAGKLSDGETRLLLDTWNAYYQSLQHKINEQFKELEYFAERFAIFRDLLNGPKFKDTPLGRRYASADNKIEFTENLIKLKAFNKIAGMEELSILSHAWREITGETSDPEYTSSEKARIISNDYLSETQKVGRLISDFIAQNSFYFNEDEISHIWDPLINNKIIEAADKAFRTIDNLHHTYTLRYDAWVKTYNFYYSKRIRFSEYLNEIGGLSDEINETLSVLPLFREDDTILPEKKERNVWETVKKDLDAIDQGLRILENKKAFFAFLNEFPDATAYLYARARTAKEKTHLDKLKNEVNEYIYTNINQYELKKFEEYVSGGEARDVMLATIKIALMRAIETGVESKEFRKWQGKAQALAKQFQAPHASSSLAVEKYKEFIELAFKNYESGANKLPEYLQPIRDEIRELFSYSSLHERLNDAAALIRKNDPELKSLGDLYLTLINSAKAIEDEIFGSIHHNINTPAAPTQENSGSSAMETAVPVKKTGGIDFRQMDFLSQPMGSFSKLDFDLPALSKAELDSFDLARESSDIQRMVEAGVVPSGDRIKKYLWACYQKGEFGPRRDGIIVCLAQICALEESLDVESSPDLREALVMAEWIEA